MVNFIVNFPRSNVAIVTWQEIAFSERKWNFKWRAMRFQLHFYLRFALERKRCAFQNWLDFKSKPAISKQAKNQFPHMSRMNVLESSLCSAQQKTSEKEKEQKGSVYVQLIYKNETITISLSLLLSLFQIDSSSTRRTKNWRRHSTIFRVSFAHSNIRSGFIDLLNSITVIDYTIDENCKKYERTLT